MTQDPGSAGGPPQIDERLKGLSPAKRMLLDRALARGGSVQHGGTTTGIPRRPAGTAAPLSFAQELLWYLHLANPGLSAYNVPRLYRVEGPLDEAALRCAVDALAERHEVLRSTYVEADDAPEQHVAASASVPFRTVDLRGLPNEAREEEATRLLVEASVQPFDLGSEFPLRVLLIRLDEARYELALITHHIASDGWSAGILTRDLTALYEGIISGTAPVLPPLEIQYGDYSAWERRELSGQPLERLLAYWSRHLEGAPPVLELPTDRPRPPVPNFQGATESALLPPALLADLHRFAHDHDASLFMVLLAGFQAVLHRHSGQADVVVGTPVAGRTRPETGDLIGYFVNMLALRTSFADDPAFGVLTRRVRESSLAGFDHEALPFSRLVMERSGGQALSHSPIYQVIFAMQNVDRGELRLGPATATSTGRGGVTAKQDFGLFASESPNGIRLTVEYRTDLFDAGTVQAMLGHLRVLLTAGVRDPSVPVSRLPLLSDAERADLIEHRNLTDSPYPRETPLHGLIEATVRRTPNAIAVDSETGTLTYGALNRRANQLARHLRALGAGPGALVGLCAERSPDLMVGLLGILKSGAAYVPLDPEYPAERLGYMLDDSGAGIVVGRAESLGRLPSREGILVTMDREWDVIAMQSGENLDPRGGPEDLAYVIYTSGSTGRPKGTMLPHRSVVNFLTSMARQPGLGPSDVLLAVTTLSFDIAGLELYLPLFAGARVAIATREVAMDPRRLAEALVETGATVMQATPSTWRMLLDDGWTGSPGLTALCGGEALPSDLAERLLPRVRALWNLYGPTETTIWSTAWTVPEGFAGATVPIGRPIANTQVYVVDRHLTPQPVGVAGELLIAGDGVGKGYHRRPDLTAERFIPDPFRPGPLRLAYRTGDLARWRRDGLLEFGGRLDHQVKLRGHRIELGEVEAALATHPAVAQAVALVRDEVLAGYLVELTATADAELAAHVGQVLPDYMVPRVWVRLPRIPLTVNGKVDRAALPMPAPAVDAPDELPTNEMEARVAALWGEALKRERVGIHANFFALGGHSLLAMRLLRKIAVQWNVRLSLRTLFEHPTIATLAPVLERATREGSSGTPVTRDAGAPPGIGRVSREAYRRVATKEPPLTDKDAQ